MSIPYMPLWVADYLGDTQHLSTAEHGAYMLLIMAYWQRGKALPADRLGNIVRMAPDEWAAAEPTIAEFFVVDGGEWKHERIEAELARAREKSSKASANAKRRHNGRTTDAEPAQSEGTCERNATHTQPQLVNKSNPLPSEQEAAREGEGSKSFDLGGVRVGGEAFEITTDAKRAVCAALQIGDAEPIVRAYRLWPGSRRARSPDAQFRSAAPKIFRNLSPDERKACQPLAGLEAEILVKPVKASPQLLARLGGLRHAH